MTQDCDDDGIERELPQIAGLGWDLLTTPDPEGSKLVEWRDELEINRTARAEFDVHSAITYGLATYLMSLSHEWRGERISFASSISDFADYQDRDRPLPSAAVHSEEEGEYALDSGGGSGNTIKLSDVGDDDALANTGGDILTLTCNGIYRLSSLMVEVWCDDKIQRSGVRRMLENAFNPVDWMTGFLLILPRYHNAIAKFCLTAGRFGDTPDVVTTGLRVVSLKLTVQCPYFTVRRLPLARPHVRGTIVSASG